jgi:eukaryotic-like serine/threonine-protein kinase
LQKLGKYEILAELGHGAMGVVYKARDPFIGRLVALKTINSNLVDRPDLLERFYQEAQSAGKLQHPNIVTVFELGQEKDTPFIAMEYLDGDSLEKTIVKQSELPLALKVGYVVRICQALEYAHKNRVVHRDIKPGNIMVNSEGVVKVVDFGIARLVDFSRTHTNMMIGTPAYMAPELFRKKKADERTDIWAVGVTFYELLCYQRPFTGDGYDIIRTIMEDEFPSLSSIVPECAAEIEPIIQRMLRKQSADRYQGMEDVLLDLEPVWNRLRMGAAVTLAERAKELYELGDLPTAYDTLRRARQIDNSNAQAKSLLEKITSEIRRSEILPKLQEHLSRGKNFLQAGQFREAQSEAEAALGLDSRHEPAQKLFSEVEAAVARAQQLEQKLRLTKQRLAEGALVEAETALRQAFELDASHPQAQDLKRQIAEEQARREKRKQLSELLHRARTFWTDLKYDECLALTSEALKNFPNEPELRNLHETAKADQAEQKKQVHISEIRRLLGQRKLAEARKGLEVLAREQPQDTTVRNLQALLTQEEQEEKRKKRLEEELTSLRSLVSTGKFREAAAKGEGLLKEFPQEYEVNDLVSYAKSEVAQQELKKNAEEREKQVRGLLETQRFREAEELARRTFQEFPRLELFRSLASEAEEKWKEQQEKEKVQREVHQRVQEIRSKIKRQELTDAIDMARQTLAAFGPDTDVTQLLHAAEVEANQRDQKRDERSQKLKDARTLVEKQDYAGATQLLQNAIASRLLEPADAQTKMMLAEIAEKEEVSRKEQQKRKKEEEKKREEKNREEEKRRKEAQKQGKSESKLARPSADEAKPSSGSGSRGPAQPMPPPNVPPAIAPTMHESATSIAASGTRPKPSVPVMTPLPAVQPGRVIQTSVRIEERIPQTPTASAAGGFLRKPAVLAVLGLALVGGIFAAIHFWPTGPVKPDPESAADISLEAEAKQLWDNHKFDESLADWTKLADHPGPLHQEAVKQMADIAQKHVAVEQLYAQGMRLLYEEKKYPEAAEKFNEVVQMNLWKMDEARHEYDIASKGPGVTPIKPLWQALFEEGKQAFDKKDYGAAAQDLQQATHTSGVSKDINSQSQRLLSVIRDREEQKKMLDQATQLERSGSKQQAKDMFGRVMKAPNGDPELVASAKQQFDQIGVIAPPPNSNPNPNPPPPKPAPDYAPVLGEARSLISQGKWDEAEGKLSGVPAGQGDSNDLRRQIESGRQEDQEFNARKGAASRAVLDKNEAVLKESSKYFAPIASQGGRHANDASDITVRIDRTLKEIESSKANAGGGGGGGGSSTVDATTIRSVIDTFALAMTEKNLDKIRSVRRLSATDEKTYKETLAALKNAKGYRMIVQSCTAPQLAGDTVTVSCTVLNEGQGIKPTPITQMYSLQRINGSWIIVGSS